MSKSPDRYLVTRVISPKDASTDRMKTYLRLLQRKNGATGREMMEYVGGKTPHNSWSLSYIATRYGFHLYSAPIEGRGLVHQFCKPGQAPTAWPDRPAPFVRKAKTDKAPTDDTATASA